MIENIEIKNFKSVFDLKLELGRFNVFIGENGCGKTNILEAIAFGGGGYNTENELLRIRGVRMTDPFFITSAFEDIKDTWVRIYLNGFPEKNELFEIAMFPPSTEYGNWQFIPSISGNYEVGDVNYEIKTKLQLLSFITNIGELHNERYSKWHEFSNFMIFAAENTFLRKFEEEGQTRPLGIRGEGLFSYLKKLSQSKEGQAQIEEVKENLALLDWFSDFGMPKNGLSNENRIRIKDKYLQAVKEFDQRSANEGFLFLLFYLTLFTSKHTPQFFAIDNIESSFNPKLCTELTKILVNLSKKHQKQVIVTTHNPALLDGLDLNDEETRLFVIRRNSKGHTVAKRIIQKPQSENHIKLSEAWMKGFIGGIPQNF